MSTPQQPKRCAGSNGTSDCPERATCELFRRYASDDPEVRYGFKVPLLRLPRVAGQACHYREAPVAPAPTIDIRDWIGGT